MRLNRKVVVTGMGVIAPNGIGVDRFWHAVTACHSGIDIITSFDAREFAFPVAGEVRGFNLGDFVGAAGIKIRRMARHSQLALAAAHLALEQTKLSPAALSSTPSCITIGVSNSAIDVIERGIQRMSRNDSHRFSSYNVTAAQPHAPASLIARFFNFTGRCQTISSACGAGLQAIAQAADQIRSGAIDMALAGGADAPITPFVFGSFTAAGMMPNKLDDPRRASRPFDATRTGGIIAEGAGLLVLENLAHALSRGAEPLLEICGHGFSTDDPTLQPGVAFGEAMRMALANAGQRPEQIDYVCAHGSSDPTLDTVESQQIKSVFGDYAYRIPVSSIKGVIGNPLAAAGPLQLAACTMAIRDQLVPPTAHYAVPDPHCDLDYVPCTPRRRPLNTVLVNVHGLGGGNACMIVRSVKHL